MKDISFQKPVSAFPLAEVLNTVGQCRACEVDASAEYLTGPEGLELHTSQVLYKSGKHGEHSEHSRHPKGGLIASLVKHGETWWNMVKHGETMDTYGNIQ